MFVRRIPNKVKIAGAKRDDCTIIALGNALNISYDLARKVLQTFVVKDPKTKEVLFKKNNPLTKKEYILMGHVESICAAVSVDNETFGIRNPMKLKEFAQAYSEGSYLALVQGHLSVVENGNIIDAWDSGERMMVRCYKIDRAKALETIKVISDYYKMSKEEHIA